MRELQRVFVHIGPPKSGTTFLQNVLFANKAALADAGVVLPRADWPAHRRTVVRLMRRGVEVPARLPDTSSPRDPWDRLLREVADSGAHTAVISAEQLAGAPAHAMRALVESFAPAAVHVVFTARDLAAVLPAEWQTRLRNRKPPTWSEYCASVRQPGGPHSPGSEFWHHQDPAAVLPRWLQHVPPERVHVLTVPRAGSDPRVLWARFCAVTGLDAGAYSLNVPRSNTSLGGVEAEVLRRVTERVAERLAVPVYNDLVKFFLAREVLEPRTQSFRLVLPAEDHAWLDSRAQQAIDYLRWGGFDVQGDLDELIPAPVPAGRRPDDVDDADVAALLTEVLASTLIEMARRQGGARWEGPRSVDEADAGD